MSKGKDVKIHRYEQALFRIPDDSLKEGLEKISKTFSLFIGVDYQKPASLMQMRAYLNDPGIIEAYEESQKQFGKIEDIEISLSKIFEKLNKEIPGWKNPSVYTYVSGFDINTGIFMVDSSLVVPIDNYLGEGFPAYKKAGISSYLTIKMTPDNLVPDVVKAMAYILYPYSGSGQTLVEQMIAAGKVLYFSQYFLPESDARLICGYSAQQLQWVKSNEKEIWSFLLSSQLLFNSDKAITSKLMMEGPFTPGLPRESPGMLGQWVGWQIVKAWVNKNPGSNIDALMKMDDYMKLFNDSGYKPSRK
ncbi:MAG: DUF2268 domain-containing putative Zn-dependent protease [Bacteroidales bacterium]|nr:DUF2268 domain-containing putative Zn-dependent protease [Bacteroidales bacterium]